jgi:hypothetical protein
MIPQAQINAWRSQSPWRSDSMVEQDLLICRTIVELFRRPVLAEHLAFRGGTALHKLYFCPARRYSEDIDLVQTKAGPIGPVFDAIQRTLWPKRPIPCSPPISTASCRSISRSISLRHSNWRNGKSFQECKAGSLPPCDRRRRQGCLPVWCVKAL